MKRDTISQVIFLDEAMKVRSIYQGREPLIAFCSASRKQAERNILDLPWEIFGEAHPRFGKRCTTSLTLPLMDMNVLL
jgi:uncharacterized membrane protein (UPF0127 family)